MKNQINKVSLLGNVGMQPELKMINNKPMCRLSLATNEVYTTPNGEKKKITIWHNIALWNKHAEYAVNTISKGQLVYVEGKLNSRQYEDKNGVVRSIQEIIAQLVSIWSSKESDLENTAATNALPF
jgi:single-strand DNA-binding protein